MDFTGGCLCGGTRYQLKSRPFALVDCHCIDCRRSAGAPYVQWGSVPRQDLVVTKGEPRKVSYASRIRSFAACCGTHLFFEDSEDSENIDLAIASLDDPTPFPPQRIIFLEDKLPWVTIDASIPSSQTIPNNKPNG
ncbi:MAG TPA: GFA family protein [Candidatus Udaeobacter sp.]|nr:GFA family protein [Candidatus Udaeobacter sp.]